MSKRPTVIDLAHDDDGDDDAPAVRHLYVMLQTPTPASPLPLVAIVATDVIAMTRFEALARLGQWHAHDVHTPVFTLVGPFASVTVVDARSHRPGRFPPRPRPPKLEKGYEATTLFVLTDPGAFEFCDRVKPYVCGYEKEAVALESALPSTLERHDCVAYALEYLADDWDPAYGVPRALPPSLRHPHPWSCPFEPFHRHDDEGWARLYGPFRAVTFLRDVPYPVQWLPEHSVPGTIPPEPDENDVAFVDDDCSLYFLLEAEEEKSKKY